MSYREHAPPVELAPWLECTWERHGDSSPVRVLPDGCIDVIWSERASTMLVGANTTAFFAHVEPTRRTIGARFRPGSAPPLLGIAAEEFRDVRADVADVWHGEGVGLAEALEESGDPLGTLLGWITARRRKAEPPDPLVRATVTRLSRDARFDAPISVPRVADRLGVSERTLRRHVVSAVGYGPKRLARVFRLGRALEAVRAGDELAGAAYEAGYVDQAHFANECRALAGASATVIRAEFTARDRFLQDAGERRRDDRGHERTPT
jgi:AraC-like DNA-binding protein